MILYFRGLLFNPKVNHRRLVALKHDNRFTFTRHHVKFLFASHAFYSVRLTRLIDALISNKTSKCPSARKPAEK